VRTRRTGDDKLTESIMEPMAMLGQAVSFMSPTGGAVIIARGEVTSRALVKFSASYPKMRKALESIGKVSPAAEVLQTLAMVIIAVQLDMRNVEPTTPIAVISGVTQIYHQMQAEMGGGMPDPGEYMEPPVASMPFPGDGFRPDGTWQSPPMFNAGPSAAVRNP
jgi:hypothetical protein